MPVPVGRNAKGSPGAVEDNSKSDCHYDLILYVAGMTPRSAVAIRRITEFCRKHLAGQYSLKIVDIYQKPGLAQQEQIIAIPTLVKRLPIPLRRFIGDLDDEKKLLLGMGIRGKEI